MNDTVEGLGTPVSYANGRRKYIKQGVGRVLFRSKAYEALNLARYYLTSYYNYRKAPLFFQDVRAYCTFIGHNKSGSSMIGSLLDAHPDIILADEMDALRFVKTGFRREQIYDVLLHASQKEFRKGRVTARRLNPYSYLVPGQWQGRYNTLRVVGDSTTGSSTQQFAEDPDLIQRLQQVMAGVHVKFIQIIRNPYDPISIMMVRGKRTFENSIEHFFANCETVAKMRKRLNSSELLAVRYEEFVGQPERRLSDICRFLGLEAGDDYLKACASILRKSPDQSRHVVEWDSHWIEVVKNKMARYDFLEGYSFEG